MTILSLDEIKTHLRIDDDAQDVYLKMLCDAAVEHASQFLGRPLPWNDAAGLTVPVPASVRAAVLLIIGGLDMQREGLSAGPIRENPAVARLLTPYRVGMGI